MIASWKIALLCLSLTIFSCVKDPLTDGSRPAEQGVPVQVELNFRVPKFDNPQESKGRAAKEQPSDDAFHVTLIADSSQYEPNEAQPATRISDAPLYNLWVFQFSDNGDRRKAIRVSTDDQPVYENQTIEVQLLTGSNQTIYLLALGRRYGHIDLSSIRTVEELEATSFDFVRYENGLPTPVIKSATDVPYKGSCDKLTIIQLEEDGKGYVDYNSSAGFGGAISMKALVSLVTIDFTYQVEEMTPFSISMNNVPTTFAVNGAIHKPSQFVNLPTTLLRPADLADGKRVTMSWYTAPNPQGVVSSITSEFDRYFYYKPNSTTPTGTAPRDATYIHVWANKDADPTNYALYYLFLGSNTTNDFTIHPHSHYRYRTDINTADELNDKRIIYKKLEQSIDFSVSDAKESIALLRKNKKYNLDAHPDMRPIEITALRGTVSVEILPGSDNGVAYSWPAAKVPPIDPSNSWLKLSVYPNYTAAIEAHRRGDPNGLATTINLDASIPGLFRLYLYSDEYEKYVSDNTMKNEHKRSLFVRFTFQTETNKSEVYTTRMDQLPAFYLGEFGGEPTMNGGIFGYPKGLVLEAISEDKAMEYLSYIPNSVKMYGAYGVKGNHPIPSNDDMHRYGAYDIYNGRSATIKMAENKYRISPIAAGNAILDRIQEPRFVNGHVDLYQYKYYTGDGFAQRWCYDKNRDTNGNGRLDDDEIVWYMPSIWQVFPTHLNYYTNSSDYLQSSHPNLGVGVTSMHSTTMSDRSNRVMFSLYMQGQYNASITNEVFVRCVRDVEPIVGASDGVKYYVEDSYPVIDATGLMAGVAEDRVDNPNVVILPGPGDDPSYTGRVIRHYMPSNTSVVPPISQRVSQRFRVAPYDVDIPGAPVVEGTYATMTWAEASGYATEANTLPITSDKTAVAPTGCAAYKGINGTDPVGKWRLPTTREILLIGMMDQAMKNNKGQTGYIELCYLDGGSFSQYWTASEKPDETPPTAWNTNHAYTLYAYGRVMTVGGEGNPAAWVIRTSAKSNKNQNLARCIYDLH